MKFNFRIFPTKLMFLKLYFTISLAFEIPINRVAIIAELRRSHTQSLNFRLMIVMDVGNVCSVQGNTKEKAKNQETEQK